MENSEELKQFVDAILNLRMSMKQYVQKKIREDKIDLTYEMLQVLAVLWTSGEMNQQDIADKIQKNKASLTSLLDNLAKRNFIIRTEDPVDRRNKIISLTDEGKQQEGQIFPLLNQFYHTLHTGLSGKEIKQVTILLKKMQNNIS
ncbi:MarR family winged helix-turn-helix transcriptional regulator [Pedobacter sp. KLB.chiD]|uniref:MarR family winged helix-turn-helix transcriptional regulator n=1 Tax=Pedobacter sp. KLB.chiD TaxID=3387402 RepID=UPI00399A9EE4